MVAVARTYKARESLSLLKEVLQLGEPIPGCIAKFSSEKALTERQCDHGLDGTAFSWASSAIGNLTRILAREMWACKRTTEDQPHDAQCCADSLRETAASE